LKRVIITLIFAFLLVGCSNEKVVQPETPFDTARLMKHHIDVDNYSRFQSLFYEGTEDTISLDTFKELG
jgi:PBP1b-binding outer membrane lipoprotein LpoB